MFWYVLDFPKSSQFIITSFFYVFFFFCKKSSLTDLREGPGHYNLKYYKNSSQKSQGSLFILHILHHLFLDNFLIKLFAISSWIS